MTPSKAELRARLRLLSHRVIEQAEQAIRDCEYWNSRHLNETPLDVEEFRVARMHAMQVLAKLEKRR